MKSDSPSTGDSAATLRLQMRLQDNVQLMSPVNEFLSLSPTDKTHKSESAQ